MCTGLYFHLAKEKDRSSILKALSANIENHKNHLTTGFVGTPYLCHALSENGAHDIASMLFMKEDYPSWLYAVNMELLQYGKNGMVYIRTVVCLIQV